MPLPSIITPKLLLFLGLGSAILLLFLWQNSPSEYLSSSAANGRNGNGPSALRQPASDSHKPYKADTQHPQPPVRPGQQAAAPNGQTQQQGQANAAAGNAPAVQQTTAVQSSSSPSIPTSSISNSKPIAPKVFDASYRPKPARTALWQRQCAGINEDALKSLASSANLVNGYGIATPIFAHYQNSTLIAPSSASSYPVGTEFCSIVLAPQPAHNPFRSFTTRPIEGWGPDGMHFSIKSDDVWLVPEHPVFVGNFTSSNTHVAAYSQAYILNHPGAYQALGAIEFQSYDWTMEGDGVDMYTMNQQTLLPYDVQNITLTAHSPAINITGVPISRPTAICHHDGHSDLHGRWYRALAFGPWGSQTTLNRGAELSFATHANVIDEWGWTFAPDACSVPYFSIADHHACLGGSTLAFHADSNSRRLLKSVVAGASSAWCADPLDTVCQCQDTWEPTLTDTFGRTINQTHFFAEGQIDEALAFGNGSRAYFDMNGGLVRPNFNHAWQTWFERSTGAADSITDRRIAASAGKISVVHLSMIGWDVGYAETPALDWADATRGLPALKRVVPAAYPKGTMLIHRLGNAPCCGNYRKRLRYNIPRYAVWNGIWREFFEDEEAAGRMKFHDAGVLEGRPDAEMDYGMCPMTHLRASHVRIESMMWLSAVCEKKDGGLASMRSDWGL